MITSEQVTGLTAQAANAATYQAYDANGNLLSDWQLNSSGIPVYLGAEIATRGVGIYGQTPEALTTVGFLKPGTLALITSPEMTLTVLNTGAVWTGQYGINSLLDYLDDPIIQNLAQIEIMQGAYQGLIDAGVLAGNESARFQATFLQPATRYGVDAVVSWILGTASTELVEKIKIASRQGQYAIDFVDKFANLLDVAVDIPGFDNTIDRTLLDATLTNIVGNEKIPALVYADQVDSAPVVPTVDEEGIFRRAPGQTTRG